MEEEAILMQRKWVLENGFHQKWVWDENPNTQRSKEILIEIDEGELGSLEKCFLREEMVK